MTVSTSVKWAVSSMTGAPTLNGTAGSLIAVLDAFLVNGFGAKAVDSAAVTDGICRMGITGGSAAQDHCVIQLAGITGGGATLNGLQRVTAATAGYVEFACDLPDGPLTGTITFKIAPLGWEKVFSKTNVAVYRSTDPAGTRAYYRVDDTNALYARVQVYESMSGVDTGAAVSPQTPEGGYYWHKRQATVAGGAFWVLAGDARAFVLMVVPASASTPASHGGFAARSFIAGDINSYRSGDAWSAVLTGAPTNVYSDTAGCVFSTAASTGISLLRASHGLGAAIQVGRYVAGNVSAVSGGDITLGPFPSRADHGLRLSPIVLPDGDMSVFGPRGELAGCYHCPQTGLVASFGADRGLTLGQGAFFGRQFMRVGVGPLTGPSTGLGLIDVTGPWRS